MPYGSTTSPKKPKKMKIPNKQKKKPRVKIGSLNDKSEKALAAHSKHHSRQHIIEMEKLMRQGVSFSAAHKKAMSAVGK